MSTFKISTAIISRNPGFKVTVAETRPGRGDTARGSRGGFNAITWMAYDQGGPVA